MARPSSFARRANGTRRRVRAGALTHVRIEAAKRALEDGKDSVTRIARDVDYQDPVAFRKVFASVTGFTPSTTAPAPVRGPPVDVRGEFL